MGDVDKEGSYTCVGTGTIWDLSVPFPHFCCEPKNWSKKTVLKMKNPKEGRKKMKE